MNILFVIAHPDDEAYGPAGTIAKLSKTNKVTVACLCKGDHPGKEHVSQIRIDSFKKSCNLLGAEHIILNFSDCRLEYDSTLKEIEKIISLLNPDEVYTHNISDIHKDHRLIAECCLVACRPKIESNIKKLYFFEIPSSTDWNFNQITPAFDPNTYIDITDYINLKEQVLGLYTSEIHKWPDARSIKAIRILAENRGRQVGISFAEAFRLVFAHDRKIQ